jgi:hypothetical protein
MRLSLKEVMSQKPSNALVTRLEGVAMVLVVFAISLAFKNEHRTATMPAALALTSTSMNVDGLFVAPPALSGRKEDCYNIRALNST